METISAKIGPGIISSYKRLSYKAWYALAEFIDNSTQAYINNRIVLDELFDKENTNLTIKISYHHDQLIIEDNSSGMNFVELENAMDFGKPPDDTSYRSKYGLGLKTSAFWFGTNCEIKTKKFDESIEHCIVVNSNQIALSNLDLNYTNSIVENNDHYTKIIISVLNRKLAPRTIDNIKRYLSSIYRKDFINLNLQLFWNNSRLYWDYNERIYNRLIKDKKTNEPLIKNFAFSINDKNVSGWAGVFDIGKRRDAGFTIIQADRVIKGWPEAWRPSTLYGASEGGSNDLVNQRLVGEICFTDFDVSHTKDDILFYSNEEDEVEAALFTEIAELKEFAQTYRKFKNLEQNQDLTSVLESSILAIENDIHNTLNFNYCIFKEQLELDEDIKFNNENLINTVSKLNEPFKSIELEGLFVDIYIDTELSVNDPYVLHRPNIEKNRVTIILNINHPYWIILSNSDIDEFIKQCIFDGVSEWKATFMNRLTYETIKKIKDNLLRLPFKEN
ncbi:MAG: ATP-binding protein [Ignavibacteriae bacterium]|nr:ATP-binding protein [Ignavibacteriota bacterium]